MFKPLLLAAAIALPLSACQLTPREQQIVGGVVGAGVGLVTASAFGANSGWTLLAVLAGATAGTLVARNHATGECAWANGDGRYRVRRC